MDHHAPCGGDPCDVPAAGRPNNRCIAIELPAEVEREPKMQFGMSKISRAHSPQGRLTRGRIRTVCAEARQQVWPTGVPLLLISV